MGAPSKALGIGNDELIRLRRDGWSIMKIAHLCNVNRKTVEAALRRTGVSFAQANATTFWTPEERQALQDLAVGGFSNAQIAARLGRTAQAVGAQFQQWMQNERRKARAKAPGGAPMPIDVSALIPVPADWQTIFGFRAQHAKKARTLAEINAVRVALGVSPYVPVEPYAAYKRRVAA